MTETAATGRATRVAIDCRSLGSGLGGDETMLRSLLRGLACTTAAGGDGDTAAAGGDGDTAADGDLFPLLVPHDVDDLPAEVAGHPAFPVHRVVRRRGPVHFAVELPRAAGALRPPPAVLFSVTHGPAVSRVPSALMVTDLSFWRHPELYPARTRARLNALVRHQAPRAAVVTTISAFCRDELLEAYGVDPARVRVVPLTVDPPLPFGEDDRREGLEWLAREGVHGPFLLYLGNLHPRKNVGRLIRGFARARASGELAGHQLVLAGGRWWAGGDEAEEAARAGAVVALGRVSDRRREQLLRLATALAYVSRYEGFGLPPLEAMVRGTPVVAAAAGALPETLGDAAVLVDPLDVDAIAAGLVEVATDDARRRELVEHGRTRAAGFSEAQTGRILLDALRFAAAQPQVRAPAR